MPMNLSDEFVGNFRQDLQDRQDFTGFPKKPAKPYPLPAEKCVPLI